MLRMSWVIGTETWNDPKNESLVEALRSPWIPFSHLNQSIEDLFVAQYQKHLSQLSFGM